MKNNNFKHTLLAVAVVAGISACDGDDGNRGPAGAQGPIGTTGSAGVNSLINQIVLAPKSDACFNGGVRFDSGLDTNANGILESSEVTSTSFTCSPTVVDNSQNFVRVATFPVCAQIDANCDTDTETAAEIVSVSSDNNKLIYTDSPQNMVGFININDAENPMPAGTLSLPGEPTSAAVRGDYALVAVNRSQDFINVAGSLEIIDVDSKAIVRSIDIGGQPDSVAVSKDGNYAAIVIENERDEDLGDGGLPQLPAGGLVVVNMTGAVADWTISNVALTGLASIEATDPEPEYVDINDNNIAVITLQENNHIVLVDLSTGQITNHFSAGSVDLTNIDATEEDAFINQVESLSGVVREPDGVTWLNNDYFATANEGDWNGGSRGFSVFDTRGNVVYDSGNTMDQLTAGIGHYPDDRSENKGNEPENAEFGIFGDNRFLFINSERSSLVFVYDVADLTKPAFKQVLPAAAGPEGALAIPERNLLVVASEEDDRGDKLRSAVNIYRYNSVESNYPTIQSVNRENGTPIPFAALSGLSADTVDNGLVYSIEDSFFKSNRIFAIDTEQTPARLVDEIRISDANDVFANISTVTLADASVDEDDATRVNVFDQADLAAMINADKTVNIDPEGIAKASDGGFWIASEGTGTVGDSDRPVNSLNFIFKTDENGVIENVIRLPDALNNVQERFGFEGIAEYAGAAYVAFQRQWNGETNVRIGIYDVANSTWSFLFYPLDAVASQNGGWVGLSDLTSLGNGQFLVLERDNQGGPDAAIKRLYRIDTNGLANGATVTKTLVRDILPDVTQEHLSFEKVEGLAVMANGDVLLVNDNDGVDDNSGETQLINLGDILQ